MLGRLILLLVQIVVGWFGTQALASYIIVPAAFDLYVFAIIAAIVVFLIGLVATQVLRDIRVPSTGTLTWALAFALIAAVLWNFGPTYFTQVPWEKIPARYAVLAAAILGYTIKR